MNHNPILTGTFFLSLAVSLSRYWITTMPKALAAAGTAACLGTAVWYFMPWIRTGPALLGIAGSAGILGAVQWQREAEQGVASIQPATTPAQVTPSPNKTSDQEAQEAPQASRATETTSPRDHAAAPRQASPQAEPANNRAEVVRALKQFSVDLGAMSDAANAASNETEVASVDAAASQLNGKIESWLAENMDGQYALSKYRASGLPYASTTPWNGSKTSDDGLNARDQLMSTMMARQANIQEMISSSQWDRTP